MVTHLADAEEITKWPCANSSRMLIITLEGCSTLQASEEVNCRLPRQGINKTTKIVSVLQCGSSRWHREGPHGHPKQQCYNYRWVPAPPLRQYQEQLQGRSMWRSARQNSFSGQELQAKGAAFPKKTQHSVTFSRPSRNPKSLLWKLSQCCRWWSPSSPGKWSTVHWTEKRKQNIAETQLIPWRGSSASES